MEDETAQAEEMLADAMARDPEKLAGEQLRRLRIARKWTQEDVARRMRAIGYPGWHQTTIAKLEAAQRPLRVKELVALAGVIGVPPTDLLSPAGWSLQTLEEINAELPRLEAAREAVARRADDADAARAKLARLDDQIAWLHQMRDLATDSGSAVDQLSVVKREAGDRAPEPDQQPVVAAIVTSDLGVLVGKRNDGKPPWTFIAGEVEPGELPEDAAVREVKEETGLEVRAGRVIGERVHPKTGRQMIYIAATPTHGTDVFVGDEVELAEVRWLGLAEADELMGGMIFEPVREHLARELGGS